MLSYALAIVVAISSLILFSTAFLMSKIHRKDDFLWSAVGLFYASILWFCARNITGTVLLGQAAATVLITSYCWQTIKLRQAMLQSTVREAIANPAQDRATETKNFSVVRSFNNLFKRTKNKLEPSPEPIVKPPAPKVTEQDIAIPKTPAATPPQAPAAAMPNVAPAVEKSAESDRVIPDSQPNLDSQGSLEQTSGQVSPQTTESLPLPNKLPEAIAQPQPEAAIVAPTPANNPADQTIVNAQPPIATESATDGDTQPIVESTPEVIAPATEKPKSSLDSLETVEVAEVLEAEIDNRDNSANIRESDRDNVIEVTTTDVKIVTETIKIDRNQADDSDSQEA